VRSVLLAVLVVLLIGTSAYNTVLNNAYAYGATLHDSTIFATIMWRSGWLLMPAPALGTESFFNTHITPIHYLPNLFSYWFPGDRITYYALVYGAVYGALLGGFIALGFIAVRRLRPANGAGASMGGVMKTWIPYGVALGLGTVVALALELSGRFPGTTM